jgi:hypothetical protein
MDTSSVAFLGFGVKQKAEKNTKNNPMEFEHFLQNENRQIESDETM